jgi:hypothetical protein
MDLVSVACAITPDSKIRRAATQDTGRRRRLAAIAEKQIEAFALRYGEAKPHVVKVLAIGRREGTKV